MINIIIWGISAREIGIGKEIGTGTEIGKEINMGTGMEGIMIEIDITGGDLNLALILREGTDMVILTMIMSNHEAETKDITTTGLVVDLHRGETTKSGGKNKLSRRSDKQLETTQSTTIWLSMSNT